MPRQRPAFDEAEQPKAAETPKQKAPRAKRDPDTLSGPRRKILDAAANGATIAAHRIWPSEFGYSLAKDGEIETIPERCILDLCARGYLDSDDHAIDSDARTYFVTALGRHYLASGAPAASPPNARRPVPLGEFL